MTTFAIDSDDRIATAADDLHGGKLPCCSSAWSSK
jgi:hypothetical protein